MESGAISDGKISASSQYGEQLAAAQGRLNLQVNGTSQGAWSAATSDANQWLQIDLSGWYRVTRVATQGRQNSEQWVTQYQLDYSNDSVNFQKYREDGQNVTKVKYLTNRLKLLQALEITLYEAQNSSGTTKHFLA